MKFAICNETFQDWPFDKAFAFARDCGYTGIEFAPFTMNKDARLITAEQRQTAKRQAADAGLEVTGLHWLLAFTEGFYLTTPDRDVREQTAAYLGDLARLCRDLGGQTLVLGSPQQRNLLPGVSHDQAMEFAADTLRSAMPAIQDQGVILAVEPLGPEEGDFLRTAALGVQLIEMVDSPACRLHLDVKAMVSEDRPVADLIRDHASLLQHFHANDANRQGPGMGKIDFQPILTALDEVGYDGWVSVEVFDYSPGIETLARESFKNLQQCLPRQS